MMQFPQAAAPGEEPGESLTLQQIVAGLRGLGLSAGDHVLTHSSLSSLGRVDGGAETVVAAIVETVGAEGTALFPTLSGLPQHGPSCPPSFDPLTAPCWTGKIPEASLRFPGAIRSLHPTHSVSAIGRLAQWFTEGHERCRTPCGWGSPYDKLAAIGGRILLIGVDQSVNTSFHHAEEVAGVPYVCQPDPSEAIVVKDGHELRLSGIRLHLYGPERDYQALEPEMLRLGILTVGHLGKAACRLIDASAQRRFLVRTLLADPEAVLKR